MPAALKWRDVPLALPLPGTPAPHAGPPEHVPPPRTLQSGTATLPAGTVSSGGLSLGQCTTPSFNRGQSEVSALSVGWGSLEKTPPVQEGLVTMGK